MDENESLLDVSVFITCYNYNNDNYKQYFEDISLNNKKVFFHIYNFIMWFLVLCYFPQNHLKLLLFFRIHKLLLGLHL